MIVVVIIGLLAALAIPAFKKVRNGAIEKSLINDARQLSAGANQMFAENPSLTAAGVSTTSLIGTGYFVPALTSGNIVAATAANQSAPAATQTAVTLVSGGYFSVSNANYNSALSSNTLITNGGSPSGVGSATKYTPLSTGLNFSVDTGKLMDYSAAVQIQ